MTQIRSSDETINRRILKPNFSNLRRGILKAAVQTVEEQASLALKKSTKKETTQNFSTISGQNTVAESQKSFMPSVQPGACGSGETKALDDCPHTFIKKLKNTVLPALLLIGLGILAIQYPHFFDDFTPTRLSGDAGAAIIYLLIILVLQLSWNWIGGSIAIAVGAYMLVNSILPTWRRKDGVDCDA